MKEVAVVGSGINALMTALLLLKKGCVVNLYLDKLPNMG
jgi:phytoene dehydrogenase-like protein